MLTASAAATTAANLALDSMPFNRCLTYVRGRSSDALARNEPPHPEPVMVGVIRPFSRWPGAAEILWNEPDI